MRIISVMVLTLVLLFSGGLQGKEANVEETKLSACSRGIEHYKQELYKTFSLPFIEVAKACTPSVVFIRAEGGSDRGNNPYDQFNDDFFNFFFGKPPRKGPPQPQVSQGSGFIVSKEGHIMTNMHVVRGAKKLTVTLQDGSGRQLPATYIGGDSHTDIAIIQIDTPEKTRLPHLELGNSEELQVGEWVVAIGNPFSLQASVSAGIISAKGRQGLQISDYEDFIQTDAAINPGNSGGPLLNLNKEVIGMNTAIVSQSGGYMGIGFAIPSSILKNIMNQIVENGVVIRGFLGVSLQPIDSDIAEAFHLDNTQGALIADVVEDSPAQKAGLRQGDIVIKLNGSPIKHATQLRNDIAILSPGTKVQLTINRNGKILTLPVTLGTFGANTLVSSTTASKHLGLSVDNLTNQNLQQYRISQDEKGIVVVEVQSDTPAYRAGITPGTLIIAVNHQKVTNINEFNDTIADIKPGDKVLLLVKKDGMIKFLALKTQ